jgi:hypothetical protein
MRCREGRSVPELDVSTSVQNRNVEASTTRRKTNERRSLRTLLRILATGVSWVGRGQRPEQNPK